MSDCKPCPFCASSDVDPEGWLDSDGNKGPECMKCGTTALTVHAWNRRDGAKKETDAALQRFTQHLKDQGFCPDNAYANHVMDCYTTFHAKESK